MARLIELNDSHYVDAALVRQVFAVKDAVVVMLIGDGTNRREQFACVTPEAAKALVAHIVGQVNDVALDAMLSSPLLLPGMESRTPPKSDT